MDTDETRIEDPEPRMNTDKTRMSTDEARIDSGVKVSGKLIEESLTREIIGAAVEVHSELGSGFLEAVYQAAMLHELRLRRLQFQAQAPIEVKYKGVPVGAYYADVLVGGKVICELKAIQELAPIHEAQLLNYLKGTGVKVGLLINFGASRCEYKRMVF
jgi:GxxExxY protein